LNKNVVSQYSF